MLGAAMFLAGCGQSGKGTVTTPAKKADASRKTDFTSSALDLAKEFLANDKAAADKYKDKVLEIEGTVNTANPIICRPGSFVLTGAKKAEKDIVGLDLHCACLPAYQDQVALLSKGQKVKVKGVFAGSNPLAVYLMDSEYTELTPATNIVVSAAELSGDFAKDKESADARYRDKEVIVTGDVTNLVERDGFYLVKLTGAKPPLLVSCTMGKEEFGRLKKGQKVRIKGNCSLFSDNEVTVNTAFLLKNE
jgi:hypothetical protein